MKEPIEIKDMKKGDLIRAEWDTVLGIRASEYFVSTDGQSTYSGAKRYFLLEAARPVLDLPQDIHAIGWLTASGTELAHERVLGEWYFGDTYVTASGIGEIPQTAVTEFIPATAVPTQNFITIQHEAEHSIDPKTCRKLREFLDVVFLSNKGEKI